MLTFSFFLSKQHNLTQSPINLLFNKGNKQSWLEYQESGGRSCRRRFAEITGSLCFIKVVTVKRNLV